MTMPLTATIVITTRDRKEELRQALQSCIAQVPPCAVLVIDDASTDGTAELVRTEFPSVRLVTSEVPQGYIVQRNRAATLVSSDVIISMDDDALFTDPSTVRQVLAEIDHPRVGAVAMPFINVRQSDTVYQRAPDNQQLYVRQWFIGTAHAIKTSVFRELGGYRDFFYSQFEEFDFALRLLNAGFVVRVGHTAPIHHLQSPRRIQRQIVYFGERNQILLTTLNAPLVACPVTWVRSIKQGIGRSLQNGFVASAIAGLTAGMVQSIRYWPKRSPVSTRTFRQWRTLSRAAAPMTLEELDTIH